MTSPADTIREALTSMRDTGDRPWFNDEASGALAALTQLEADRDRLADTLREITALPQPALQGGRQFFTQATDLARAALATPDTPLITHGRHCPCSACAREDWTRITGPCGIHGASCPAVYAPIAATPDTPPDYREDDLHDRECAR